MVPPEATRLNPALCHSLFATPAMLFISLTPRAVLRHSQKLRGLCLLYISIKESWSKHIFLVNHCHPTLGWLTQGTGFREEILLTFQCHWQP